MRITKVEMHRTINLGNYNNVKLGAEAEVGPKEDPEAVAMELSAWLARVAARAKASCVQESSHPAVGIGTGLRTAPYSAAQGNGQASGAPVAPAVPRQNTR